MQVVIYKQDSGSASIIYPTQEAIAAIGINAIAAKDVPTGKPYKIMEINAENFPLDGTVNEVGIPNIDKVAFSEWEINEADLTDGVGA